MDEPQPVQVTSEVGTLRTVVLHRPGEELRRLTPRNAAGLLFDALPWVERAQAEHDAFAQLLRTRGVEVRYVLDLLVETLRENAAARAACVDAALALDRVGPTLAAHLRREFDQLTAEQLAEVLVGGLSVAEIASSSPSLLVALGGPAEFVVPPLPNLLFVRDSAFVVGTHVAVGRPTSPARRREASILDAIWSGHPQFARTPRLDTQTVSGLEGGDVLVLGEGVVAVGIGQRTTPAGAEVLADELFAAGLASRILAVPIAQDRATMHLDTVATMVDKDAIVMFPPIARTLEAWTLTPGGISGPEPFLVAAARALEVAEIRVIGTGLDPVTAEREQWDDGNNTLALAPGVVVAYERNSRTNERLHEAGVEVLTIPGSELSSGRGGPRCLSCPVNRDPISDRWLDVLGQSATRAEPAGGR